MNHSYFWNSSHQIVALAAVYLILGIAGLELTTSAGYGTVIFPAAGLAVALVLYGGVRLLPLIFLGSIAINFWITYRLQTIDLKSVFLVLVIAVGATAQAYIAHLLVKRSGIKWKELAKLRDITVFVLLAGPIASLISATWSNMAFYIFDVINTNLIPSVWFSWWIGDTLGVILFAPITLLLLFRKHSLGQYRIKTVGLPTLLALIVVSISYFYFAHNENVQINRQLEKTGSMIKHHIQKELKEYVTALTTLSNLINISPDLTFTQFNKFTQSLLTLSPDLHLVSWNPYVSNSERNHFESEMAKIFGQYEIKELGHQDRFIRAQKRDYYVPVAYISSFNDNNDVLGFDIASNTLQFDAIKKVLETGEMSITSPILQKDGGGSSISTIFISPIKKTTDNNQNNDISGFAVAMLQIDKMMNHLNDHIEMQDIGFELQDKEGNTTGTPLYRKNISNPYHNNKFLWKTDIDLGNRTWQLAIFPDVEYIESYIPLFAWQILLIGLIITSLLQILLLGITGQHYLAKTALEQSESDLQSILDNSPFLIWQKDQKGRYLNINKKYADTLASQGINKVINKTDFDIWPREIAEGYFSDDQEVLLYKTTKYIPEEPILDGNQLRFTETYKSPLFDHYGNLRGTIGFSHDITERKKIYQQLVESEARFSELFKYTPIAYLCLSPEGMFIDVNQQLCEMLGYSQEELLHQNFSDVWFDETRTEYESIFKAFNDVGQINTELTLKKKDNKLIIVLLSGRIQKDTEDNLVKAHCVLADITEREKMAQEMRISAIAFQSQNGMFVTDASGNILRVNDAFTLITGYTSDEVIGENPRILSSGIHDANFYDSIWKSVNKTGSWQGEIWNKRKNGELYPEQLTITAVMNANETITHYVANLTDITNKKAAEAEIHSLAFYDPLTKLPNRSLFMERLTHAIDLIARTQNKGALFFLDIDHFKTLNDTLGHQFGDQLLQQVALRIKENLREHDTVSRFGGDEFVVLLENLSKDKNEALEDSKNIANKILSALNKPYQLGKNKYQCGTSIGMTIIDDETAPDILLSHGDIAMYQAKNNGRNSICIFDPQMQYELNEYSKLEQELLRAFEKKQFQLYYQMQVDHSKKPYAAEALIRWIHPTQGLISPNKFIPVAEKSGLIIPIGDWVIHSACSQLKLWQQQEKLKDFVLSINVSAKQLHQANFAEKVESLIRMFDINPELLKFELTESMLLDNLASTINIINAIKKLGVKFSLDDFGTGYSSLQYLKILPLDQLKIDQSFVRDIVEDENDRTIVRTIIAMANNFNIGIIAEGVETNEQLEILKTEGCNKFQGYLFGKPVPIEQFENAILASSSPKDKESILRDADVTLRH
ncbi:EAL domain-containing protein [Shewanella aestuarii]|uniref:cyclic-guanylate-specific phosphodiesterase n=1 Tax=Shewanella aestuarii TaxID=1028752 RepID=A0A6G9QKS4_9GAMM|nr:EAL domain-containing protein [Shewanella aestuarii]QIR15072.1 EAL domain-containing protein [Shewanella aestuarii]